MHAQSMYRGKKNSLKTILCRILERLKDEDLVLKEKISRKNVQYSLKDRRKVRSRLNLKCMHAVVVRQSEELLRPFLDFPENIAIHQRLPPY